MESSTYPWPRGSLKTHFQVLGLGLGLGLVKFSMTQRCTDTAAKKVLMIRAKTVISVSSFPCWQDVTTIVMRFCHKTGMPARALWHDVPPHSTGKGRHGTDFWVYAVCPWPWPCHLCPWLYHCLLAGEKRGAFTCVGRQVTLCDLIWQVTSRSCEMKSH